MAKLLLSAELVLRTSQYKRDGRTEFVTVLRRIGSDDNLRSSFRIRFTPQQFHEPRDRFGQAARLKVSFDKLLQIWCLRRISQLTFHQGCSELGTGDHGLR